MLSIGSFWCRVYLNYMCIFTTSILCKWNVRIFGLSCFLHVLLSQHLPFLPRITCYLLHCWATKALVRLRKCADSPKPSLLAFTGTWRTCKNTLYEREGRSLCCWTNCFCVHYAVIIQVTKSCTYPFNKQLHAVSSALYQKFATFTVLLSYCFFCGVWLYSCDGCMAIFVVLYTFIGASAYCHLISRYDETILSSCIDQSDDTIHLLQCTHAHKATKMAEHPSHEYNQTSFRKRIYY